MFTLSALVKVTRPSDRPKTSSLLANSSLQTRNSKGMVRVSKALLPCGLHALCNCTSSVSSSTVSFCLLTMCFKKNMGNRKLGHVLSILFFCFLGYYRCWCFSNYNNASPWLSWENAFQFSPNVCDYCTWFVSCASSCWNRTSGRSISFVSLSFVSLGSSGSPSGNGMEFDIAHGFDCTIVFFHIYCTNANWWSSIFAKLAKNTVVSNRDFEAFLRPHKFRWWHCVTVI